jgi:hypothetical protein
MLGNSAESHNVGEDAANVSGTQTAMFEKVIGYGCDRCFRAPLGAGSGGSSSANFLK